MSPKINKFLSGTLLSGLLLAAGGTAHAIPYYWIGPDNGSWNSSANWLPFGVPGAADDAIIGVKRKVSVPLDALVKNLTVGAGSEIRNTGKIKVTGKTDSFGLFIGLGSLEIPLGGNATFNVDATNTLAALTGTSPAVVFAPINNKGTVITKVAAGCRVDFATIQNNGITQIVSDGKVTFKDIKNTQQIDVSSAGDLTFAKIENVSGAKLNITSTIPSLLSSVPNIVGGLLSTLAGSDDNSDDSVVHLDSLTNRVGGTVKLTGMAGSRFFDGNSITNEGDLQLSGARTMLEADLTNAATGTLTLDSNAVVFPSDGKVPKVRNFGEIIKPAGHDATLNVDWTNSGSLIVENGTLRMSVPLGKGCKQTGGTTTLEGGTLAIQDPLGLLSIGTYELAGGVLDGIGTIQGNVVNSAGRVSPGHSPGTVTINGNYTQTSGGVLDMEVGGTSAGNDYDQLQVNGTANLDGTLNFVRWGNFVPSDGDVYTLLTFYSRTGKFAKFVDGTPATGLSYSPILAPSAYEVTCYSTAKSGTATDSTAPTVSISSPINNDSEPSYASAAGKASDASGIKSITCRLYRYTNPVTGAAAGFWAGGTNWTANATTANELAAKGTTAWTFAFPTLVIGRYSLVATATDTAGNKTASSTVTFWVDPNAPSVLTIDAPSNGSTVTAISSLNGSVSDASDGSGVVSVTGQLRRLSDGYYWNGSSWVTAVSSLSNTISGAKWSRTASLPTGTNLKAGKYTLTVVAADRAGNTKTVSSTFTANPTAASTKSTKSG